ncbi:MAG TPA: tRNA pseudouridine(38-40) synthase TruA [Gemmatimonadales bacterium]|nr:tRNA pseudouridine(38-40) synthase TruA [Gemmatimonadales bacterium]
MTRTFLALLHFDGRGFIGWQRQAAGRSVQGVVEQVLSRLAAQEIAVAGAGRTDAGVHAEGLGVSFAMPARWEAAPLRRGLNALLPPDCWAEEVREMAPGFHARKSALTRSYRYVVGTDDSAASPFRRPYEWALRRPLDFALLERAADVIRGEHVFEAFSVRGQEKAHYRCTLARAEWQLREGRGAVFHVEADRFLHHMVRMLVGTMVDIALHRRPLEDMKRLLAGRDNQETSAPAPPEGLYFVRATYPASLYRTPAEDLHETLREE